MKRNGTIYRKWQLFDNVIEMSIPIDFVEGDFSNNDEQVQLPKEKALWANKYNDTISICKVEANEYSTRDIIQAARSRLMNDKGELKCLGFYSCTRDDVEKVMSEDELCCGDDNIYIISSVFRYKNLNYIIYYTGFIGRKALIKERMLYILDSIHFNIKE